MAIARNVINAQLSFWCHCKALGLAFCCFKYVLSGVNIYLTIEIEAIPDPSQKVPKNEEFWMNEQFTFGDFASNFLLKTNGGFEACITQLFFISVRPFFLCFFNHYTFKVTIFRFLMLEFVFELLHWNVSIHSKLLIFRHFLKWVGYCVYRDCQKNYWLQNVHIWTNKMPNPRLYNDTKMKVVR